MRTAIRKIVSTVIATAVIAGVAPATFAAVDSLSAANQLASEGIIVDQSANVSAYRLGQNVLRQEAVGVAGRIKDVIPTTDPASYTCQGYFTDTAENWVCRAAELGADNQIVTRANSAFNPTRNVTRYEAAVMMMKAVCINPIDAATGVTHVEQTAARAVETGVISSAATFEPNRAATRGEVFSYAATLMDYADANPSELDPSLPGCENAGSGNVLCVIDPSLPGCSGNNNNNSGSSSSDGRLDVDLASDTPAEQDIPRNASSVMYTTFTVEASDDDVVISEIWVERQGLGSKNDFDRVWISEDSVIVSDDKAINSDDEVKFTGLNIVVEAGETRTFTVEASMDIPANVNTVKRNRLVVQAIAANADVYGTPVVGNYMRTIDYDVSDVFFDDRGSSSTVEVGDEDEVVGEFELRNVSVNDNDVEVMSIRLENDGTAEVSDLGNISLYQNSNLISDNVIVSGDYVTFIIDGGFTLEDGDNRTFEVRADIIRGDDGDAYQFQLEDDFDLRAYEEGTSIGVDVNVTSNQLAVYTVDAGRFSVSLDTESPANEDYVRGTDDVVVVIAKADAAQTVSVEGLKVHLDAGSIVAGTYTSASALETAIENDLENVRLKVNGSTIDSLDDVECTGTTVNTCYYEFDADFDLSDDDLISVVVDLRDVAVNGNRYGVNFSNSGAGTDFDSPEYTSTGDDVDVSDRTGSVTSNYVTIDAATVSISRNDGYVNEVFVAGSNQADILKFVVDAGDSSDLMVDRLSFTHSISTGCDYTDFTNVRLYADGVQVGSTEDFDASSVEFDSLNVDIDANDEVQFVVTADIDSGVTGTGTPACTVSLSLNTGSSSIDDVNDDPVALTVAAPFSDVLQITNGGTLTIALDGNTADSALLVADTNDNALGTWKLSATDDDIDVTDLYVYNTQNGASTAGSAQVDTCTVGGSVTAGDVFTINVNGTAYSYTAVAGDTSTSVASALAGQVSSGSVTAAASGSVVTLTSTSTGVSTFTSTCVATSAAATPSAVATTSANSTAAAAATAQVDIVTVAFAETGDVYTITADGQTWTYTVQASDIVAGNQTATDNAVAAQIRAVVATGTAGAAAIVTPLTGTNNEVVLTAGAAGNAFTTTASATNGGVNSTETATVTTQIANQPAVTAQAQIVNVTIGTNVAAGDSFTIVIAGTPYSYTAVAGDTPASVATALAAVANADANFSATASGAVITLTETTGPAGTDYTITAGATSGAATPSMAKTTTPGTAGVSGSICDGRISLLKLVVNGVVVDTATPVNGAAHFELSSGDLTVPKNSNARYSVLADFNDINQAAKTGCVYSYETYALEAESNATGDDINTVASPTGTTVVAGTAASSTVSTLVGVVANPFQLVKSAPTIVTASLGKTQLANTLNEPIYAWTVSADAKGDISWKFISFDFTASAAGLGTGAISLAEVGGNVVPATCFASATTGGTIECELTGLETVSAGSSITYELRVDTTLLTSSVNDQTSVNIDQLTGGFTPYTGAGTSAYAAFVTPSPITAVGQGNGAFVWTDNAGVDGSLTENHWFQDYELNGLNTTSIELES